MELTPERALFELTLVNAEASSTKFEDILVEGIKAGIPAEIMTRLEEFWDQVKIVAGHVVCVGKVVLLKIFEFIKANPQLSVGLAFGAAVGFVASSAIPILGAAIAPLATLAGALYGAGVAQAREQGDHSGSIPGAAIALAQAFLRMLVSILDGVTQYVKVELEEKNVRSA